VELEADTAHERAHLVLQQMLRVTNGLREGHVSDEEFERLMKRTRWQHEAYADEPGACADFFARAEMCATARTPHERLQQLLAVSREEIRAAAERIFRAENRNVVCVGSAKKKPLSDLALTSR
jgi:predicted Zn-dependent peptidase